MKRNIGTIDSVIRILVGVILIGFYVKNILAGFLGIVSLILGIILILTAFIGYCHLYKLLGINTCKIK